jgi:hypothetical protein
MEYRWLLFIHIGAVLVFMLAHGVHVAVTWKKRWVADPATNLTLFEALTNSLPLRAAMAAMIVSGLLLTAALNLWSQPWIWLSLAILAAIWLTMWRWGGEFYNLIQETAERAIATVGTPGEATARAEFDRARFSWLVPAMTVVGIGGVALVLWLMIFRPTF